MTYGVEHVPPNPRPSVGSARRTLVRVQELIRTATALLGTPERLRQDARERVAALTEETVRARLREQPVSSLRAVVGPRVRLAALEDAGFRSVADVLAAPDHQLQQVPGVGPATVQEVRNAARTVALQVQSDVQFRFDPDRQDAAQAQLLAVVAAIRAADDASVRLREPVRRLVAEIAPLAEEAERAGRRLGMIFAGRHRKDAARAALTRLDEILGAPQTRALEAEIAAHTRAADPRSYQARKLQRSYERDAARVNAVLSTVGGTAADDEEAAGGFVPEELRRRISATPLDTSLLTATLRGYQVFGARYALHQEKSILGDEMGLGKTIQAIAAFAHLAANGQRRFLVVCPASVQINWLKETAKHSTLATHALHGPGREDAGRRWLREGGVAVTTFGTLDKLPDEVRGAGTAMLVVDEAHFVKNPTTARSKAVAAAVGAAQRTLFLTGTPMENRVEEFRTLVGYLQPGVAQRVDPTDAVVGAKAFRRAVAPVYLRRNQVDVLTELPGKIETEAWVQLSPSDDQVYAEALAGGNLMAMRQATLATPGSAKLERLKEIQEEAEADGMKVVVFSFFLDTLTLIEETLGKFVVGTITGAVPPTKRQSLVDEFSRGSGHAVLLAQIAAGGVGINMQAASVVVLAEPQWKPSEEEQAIARAHRMGQVRTVQVHRLLAKDSIDERVREIQEGKTLLFDHFARRSDAKDADPRAVDTSLHRPPGLDDERLSTEERILRAERHRLGLG